VPLPPAILEAIARGDASVAARRLDAKVPDGWTDTMPASERLEQLTADPGEQAWLVRAVVLRAPRRVVGNVGSTHRPTAMAAWRSATGSSRRSDATLTRAKRSPV
jgi:hypothetical protein